jgi:hypothetical protein
MFHHIVRIYELQAAWNASRGPLPIGFVAVLQSIWAFLASLFAHFQLPHLSSRGTNHRRLLDDSLHTSIVPLALIDWVTSSAVSLNRLHRLMHAWRAQKEQFIAIRV